MYLYNSFPDQVDLEPRDSILRIYLHIKFPATEHYFAVRRTWNTFPYVFAVRGRKFLLCYCFPFILVIRRHCFAVGRWNGYLAVTTDHVIYQCSFKTLVTGKFPSVFP